ncbi:MAG: MFS transporter [Oscillospiraceae bacterium]|nr:MFS transporter [Oscillospiraceae bacterium]
MKKKLFTRNFTFLILGQISSLLGNYTLKFALSMYVLEKTGSASVFAGLLAAAMLPTIFLSPFGGLLADRANRRNIMVGLDALSGTAVLAAGLALPVGHDIFVIGALLIVLSVLGAFESPTVQACVPQMLSGDNIVKGNAAVSQVSAIAGLVTPFLGSVLYTALGLGPVLYGAVVCFFITAFFECFIRLEYHRPERSAGILSMVREDFTVSMRFLCREQPGILKLLLLAALVSLFVAGTVVVGFPYLVRTVLGLSAEYYGAAESFMGAAAIGGSVLVGALASAKKLRMKYLAGVLASFGACLIPCGVAFLLPVSAFGRYVVLVAMLFLCQAGCSFFSTCAISAIQGRTPEGLMGKIMSYVFTLSMCAQPVGQMVYGVLFDRFSAAPYWVLLPSGIFVCVIGLMSSGFFQGLDDR